MDYSFYLPLCGGLTLTPTVGYVQFINALYLGPVGKRDHAFHGVNHAFGVHITFFKTKQKRFFVLFLKVFLKFF